MTSSTLSSRRPPARSGASRTDIPRLIGTRAAGDERPPHRTLTDPSRRPAPSASGTISGAVSGTAPGTVPDSVPEPSAAATLWRRSRVAAVRVSAQGVSQESAEGGREAAGGHRRSLAPEGPEVPGTVPDAVPDAVPDTPPPAALGETRRSSPPAEPSGYVSLERRSSCTCRA